MFVEHLLILAVAICAALAVDYHETLDDTYDGSNASIEELAGMLDCISDTGPCTPLGASFRQHFPEVVIKACARCSPVQKQSICKFMKKLREVLPKRFEVFVDKYDPRRIYFDNFIAAVAGC